MNMKEKKLIIDNNFDTLWRNLWVDLDNINNRIKREYEKSKINFNTLKKKEKMNLQILLINQQPIMKKMNGKYQKAEEIIEKKIELVQYVNLKKKQIFQKINIKFLIMLCL